MTTTAKWFSMSKLHDQDVEMCPCIHSRIHSFWQVKNRGWPVSEICGSVGSCRVGRVKSVRSGAIYGRQLLMCESRTRPAILSRGGCSCKRQVPDPISTRPHPTRSDPTRPTRPDSTDRLGVIYITVLVKHQGDRRGVA